MYAKIYIRECRQVDVIENTFDNVTADLVKEVTRKYSNALIYVRVNNELRALSDVVKFYESNHK